MRYRQTGSEYLVRQYVKGEACCLLFHKVRDRYISKNEANLSQCMKEVVMTDTCPQLHQLPQKVIGFLIYDKFREKLGEKLEWVGVKEFIEWRINNFPG